MFMRNWQHECQKLLRVGQPALHDAVEKKKKIKICYHLFSQTGCIRIARVVAHSYGRGII